MDDKKTFFAIAVLCMLWAFVVFFLLAANGVQL